MHYKNIFVIITLYKKKPEHFYVWVFCCIFATINEVKLIKKEFIHGKKRFYRKRLLSLYIVSD